MRGWTRVAVAAGLSLATAAASAGVLEVTPILSDVVTAADGATSITLRNRGTTRSVIQLRLKRWRLVDGAERLEDATGIGVSPPFATVAPGASHVIRIVRTSKQPIAGEEAYRLLLDELPAPDRGQGAVALTIRHELPVFFRNPAATAPQVRWSLTQVDGGQVQVLSAINAGDRRLRVSGLRLTDSRGTVVDFGAGLAGYVLGHQARRWRLPDGKRLAGNVTVELRTETGPLKARAEVAVRPGT